MECFTVYKDIKQTRYAPRLVVDHSSGLMSQINYMGCEMINYDHAVIYNITLMNRLIARL